MTFDREKTQEFFLSLCFHGRPWISWGLGWNLPEYESVQTREHVLEMLSEMLAAGDIVAGTSSGWMAFEPWDLSPEESMDRIRERWRTLGRRPRQGDIAAFTMTDERRSRHRAERYGSAEEQTKLHRRRERDLASLLAEIRDLPNLVAEWPSFTEQDKEFDMYEWDMQYVGNMLIPLERDYRDGLLTDTQVKEYRQLKREFRLSRQLLERVSRDYPQDVIEGR